MVGSDQQMIYTHGTEMLRTGVRVLPAFSEGRDISPVFLPQSAALFGVDPEVREVSQVPVILEFPL
jgi:hypothetical protein